MTLDEIKTLPLSELEGIDLDLKVSYDPWCGYVVTDNNYEPGYPMSMDRDLRTALDSYLEQAHEFYIEHWNYTSLTYNWK